MRIILTGPKGSGKSTVGRLLGQKMNLDVVETDDLIEEIFEQEYGQAATCREICRQYGEPLFRELEMRAAKAALNHGAAIICTGGQTLVAEQSRQALTAAGTVVFLKVGFDKIWERVTATGTPAYFPKNNQKEWFRGRVDLFNDMVGPIADITVDVTELSPAAAAEKVMERLQV